MNVMESVWWKWYGGNVELVNKMTNLTCVGKFQEINSYAQKSHHCTSALIERPVLYLYITRLKVYRWVQDVWLICVDLAKKKKYVSTTRHNGDNIR